MPKSDAFIESKSLRESVIKHTEVLDKIKGLTLLPDDLHITVQMAADYFEVGKEAIKSLIKDNRDELDIDGVKVLTGDDLDIFVRSFKNPTNFISNKARSLTIIPRRAVLRMGMLLRDSFVARGIRSYLLNIEQGSTPRQKDEAVKPVRLSSANNMVKILLPVMKNADLAPKIQLLTIKDIYRTAGIDLPFDLNAEKQLFDCDQIAKKLGIYSKSGKPAKTAVSQLIKQHIKVSPDEFETVYETNGSWQGTVDKYAQSVIDRVSSWIRKNNHPREIKGASKTYHVVYKVLELAGDGI